MSICLSTSAGEIDITQKIPASYLIFVCKYRKKLLTGSFADDIKNIMTVISRKYDFEIKTIESDKDHIHLLVSSTPQISVSQIVRV